MTERSSRATSYNARLGLWLFALYLALYAAFVYLSAFRNDLMARPVLGGVNLAIVYGFGLIFAAFVLAVVYMLLCKSEEEPQTNADERR